MRHHQQEHPLSIRLPVCPHCQTPLLMIGKVIDVGDYKRWIDQWHCPLHGEVQPSENERPAQTGSPAEQTALNQTIPHREQVQNDESD